MKHLSVIPALLLFTLQIIAQPTLEWVRTYNGTANQSDNAQGILIDPSGNIYVTGSIQESNTGYDICTIKYNSSGDVLWVRKFNSGPGASSDGALKIMQDKAGNILIAGNCVSSSSLSVRNVVILKYDAQGNELWHKTIIDSSFNWLQISDFDLDSQDNILFTGDKKSRDTLSMSFYSCVTYKLDSSGNFLWSRQLFISEIISTFGNVIRVSPAGKVIVAACKSNMDINKYIVIKYEPDGNETWRSTSNNLGSYSNSDILLDNSENIYLPCSENINWSFKAHLVKLNSSGNVVWDKIYPGDSTDDTYINRLKFDRSGNIIAIGYDGPLFKIDYLTIKYAPQGNELWHRKYTRTSSSEDWARDVDLDSSDNIYITGGSYVSLWRNTASIKYDKTGTTIWIVHYGPPNESTGSGKIKVSRDMRNIFVAGGTATMSGITDFLILKYSQPIGVQQISSEVPDRFSLSQNYPNPFNPTTKIRFTVPSVGAQYIESLQLRVCDILGREVAVLVNEHLKPGTYEAEWDASNFPSGVYFYRLTAGDFTDSKKMILVK